MPGLTRNPLLFQRSTLLDAGSVIPDLIRDRHDRHKLYAFLNYDTAAKRMAWIFGHRPERQGHNRALIVAFSTGCEAAALKANNQPI
jgi:hypothetical protein